MKSTFDIIAATAELFSRFSCQMPNEYMQEVFGKDCPILAEKCLQYPKYGVSAILQLIYSLKSDEQEAMARYINRKDKI